MCLGGGACALGYGGGACALGYGGRGMCTGLWGEGHVHWAMGEGHVRRGMCTGLWGEGHLHWAMGGGASGLWRDSSPPPTGLVPSPLHIITYLASHPHFNTGGVTHISAVSLAHHIWTSISSTTS